MKRLYAEFLIYILFTLSLSSLYAQETDSSIYMDFRNQKIPDIIYSVAEVCGESVIIDETVTIFSFLPFSKKRTEKNSVRSFCNSRIFNF